MSTLAISGLRASVDGHEILRGIDLEVESARVDVIMGPNGSGKSTLANVVLGHPAYEVTGGDVTFDGRSLLGVPTHERAALGIFQVMQYPTEVPGVRLAQVLEHAFAASSVSPGTRGAALHDLLRREATQVGLAPELLERSLNVDFSGGEKKRLETVQLAVVSPAVAILDEIDSGLDVDALRDVARRIEALTTERSLGVLAITHYARLLDELKADRIHVLMDGRIVKTGGPELAKELEQTGYEGIAAELGIELVTTDETRAGKEAGKGVAMEVEGPMTQGLDL